MTTVRLELQHAGGATPVWVGAGVSDEAAAEWRGIVAGKRVFAITAPPVRRLHGERLQELLAAAADLEICDVADGESAKSVETATGLWRRLLVAGGKRDSLVAAFGGGSVGDLAGFVAGCFLRGIDFVQIPTTLLAQVDAAIGGKTAVNLPEAKNSVGVFHHPLAVLCDTRLLETMSPRQLRSGLFEVVKTAAVLDAGLLDLLEANLEGCLGGDAELLAPVVERTAVAKIAVVAEDPEEHDRRRLLNFGHTLGHALELAARSLEHGEAVGYGMLFALELAEERGLAEADAGRIRTVIGRLGLPPLPADLDLQAVIDRLERDKKAREGGIAWVLPEALGRGSTVTDVGRREIGDRLPSFVERGC